MHSKKLLIFPCHIPHGEAFAANARQLGVDVVRATSVAADCNDQIHYLPFISDAGFASAFQALIREQQIDHVYAAHDIVLHHLKTLSADAEFSGLFTLCNDFNHRQHDQAFQQSRQWAAEIITQVADDAALNPPLSLYSYANLHKTFHQIPGETDTEKLGALANIFTHAVKGDVVEIGCSWGRSSYALGFLARQYQTGNVISVDPWALQASLDQGDDAGLVNKAVHTVNWEGVFQGFLTNIAGLGNINYIRNESVKAAVQYQQAAAAGHIETPELGVTAITGSIAVLHIDGNHKYDAVKEDIESWMPQVKSNGWILLDDYEWSFGDGPQRAGDELKEHPRVARWFVSSDTLFLQLH